MGAEMYDEFGEHPSHNADSRRMPRPNGRERTDAAHRHIPEGSPAHQARAGVARTHVSARDDDAAPSQRTAGRPVSRPSSRAGGRPSHSGRILPHDRNGQRYSPSASAGARPRRASDASHGKGRGAQVDAASAPYQDHDRYMRIAQKPERPGRRLASVLAGVGLVAAVIIGVVLFVQQADGRKFRAELPVSVDSRSPVMRSEIQDLFGSQVWRAS